MLHHGDLLVHGVRCSQVGRITMDMSLLDVTALRGRVALGDEAVIIGRQGDDEVTNSSPEWRTLLPEARLKMDQQHYFDDALERIGPVSHVRVSIYPDGGISRVRLFGQVHG